MSQKGKHLSFDEMRTTLGIDEDALKRIVSEGYIRALREGDQMRFRAIDVKILIENMIAADDDYRVQLVVLTRDFTRILLGLMVETQLDSLVSDGSLWEFTHRKYGRVYLRGQVRMLTRAINRALNHSDEAVMAWRNTPPANTDESPKPGLGGTQALGSNVVRGAGNGTTMN